MSDFGIKPTGVVIKRLDTIINELHDDLSSGFNVNTRLNPESFLNVQLTAFADKIAELWEFGESIYQSMYPFSAEGLSLDNAAQFGGVSREEARPSFYPIHCECIDGTVITAGTTLKTSTNPAIQFIARADTAVTRGAFNKARVIIAALYASGIYTVAINGTLYSFTCNDTPTTGDVLQGLSAAITDANFSVSVSDNALVIEDTDAQRSNELVLSGNLTTETVTALVNFGSEDNGDFLFPNGTINQIVRAPEGLLSVVNLVPYIAGRVRQNDVGFRKSYADKIYARSSGMMESIKSAILLNVQGVRSVACYQNDTDAVDAYGRYPHSVEVVADGGADGEIAQQIWNKKAAGINTFGSSEVVIIGNENEEVTVRFNRPEIVYTWFRVTITMTGEEPLPPNYVEAITNIIIDEVMNNPPGRSIIPQKMIDWRIFREIPGIGNILTESFYTTDQSEQPDSYATGLIPITPRQKAITEQTRIEVILGG